MTATRQSVTDAIHTLLAAHPESHDQRLHVAEPVHRFLRERYVTAMSPTFAEAVLGLPIVADDDLTGGQWQLREDGEVVQSGNMAPAPEGMTVDYSPHAGWIAIRSDLAEFPAWANWEMSK